MRRPQNSKSVSGVTLVEMLVCMALSSLLAIACIGLMLSARANFSMQDEHGRLTESGLVALASLERAVRQAGFENWLAEGVPLINGADLSASIGGLDDARLDESAAGLVRAGAGLNGSDALSLRFFGSGRVDADGTMVNCVGAPVAEPADGDLEQGRGWSIFHIGRSAGNEPELRCKYRAANGTTWHSEALISGVESMQVLYGVDDNGDGLAQRYVSATQLQGSASTPAAAWKNVVSVRIALLLRGQEHVAEASGDRIFDLFGPLYSKTYAATDPGVRIREEDLSARERKRLRRVYSLTIHLRQGVGQHA